MESIKKSLNKKIFFYFFISFIFIISIIFIIQYKFLDSWYFNSKVNEMRDDIKTIHGEIENKNQSIEELISEIVDFKYRHGVYISISTEKTMNFEENSPIVFRAIDGNNNVIDVLIDDEKDTKEFIFDDYNVGDEVYIEGILKSNRLYVTTFEDKKIVNDLIPDSIKENSNYVDDVTLLKMGYKMLYSTYRDVDFINETYDKDYYSYEDEMNGEIIIGFVETIELDHEKYTIFIEKSMRSIKDSAKIFFPFYVFSYILSIILAFVIIFKLSKSITKPIKEMNEITKSMTHMNFSNKIDYKSDDELGELSNNINYLSLKLNETMTSLMNEIENEHKKDKDRSHFFSSVSHELKTPLSISRGYIEFLIDGVRVDKTEEYLSILQNENERMTDIVMKMLDLIKIEEKKEVLVIEKQPILPLIHEVERYFDVMLHDKNISIEINGDFTQCYFDEKSMIKILINLVSNAINYSAEGECIVLTGVLENKTQKIILKNKALNYQELDLKSIFQNFYTTDKSRNRKTSGTGLGLSIVKSIFERSDINYFVSLEDEYFVFEFNLDIEKSTMD